MAQRRDWGNDAAEVDVPAGQVGVEMAAEHGGPGPFKVGGRLRDALDQHDSGELGQPTPGPDDGT